MATGGYRADFDPPLPEKYRCGACLLAVREAHETPVSYDPVCGHLFCASCAAWILDKPEDERVCPADGTPIKSAKPTPYIDRKLVVLKVRCPNARFGCPDMMALSELEGHAEACGFAGVDCPDCGLSMVRRDLAAHLEGACPKRRLPCPWCGVDVCADELDAHKAQCDIRPVPCPAMKWARLAEDTAARHPAGYSNALSGSGWSSRYGHTVVALGNKMFVIGGMSRDGVPLSDVWAWECATEHDDKSEPGTEVVATSGGSSAAVDKLGADDTGSDSDDGQQSLSPSRAELEAAWWADGGVAAAAASRAALGNSAGCERGQPGTGAGTGPGALREAAEWRLVTGKAPWAARAHHCVVVVREQLVLFGGVGKGGKRFSDVWTSTDGERWTRRCVRAGWCARSNHAAVIAPSSGHIVMMGGFSDGHQPINDVWCSVDGCKWDCMTTRAAWAPRFGHAVTPMEGKIFLCAGLSQKLGEEGQHFGDTWASEDGKNWSLMSDEPEWRPRTSTALVACNRKLYLFGGVGERSVRMSDVWRSTDGVTWSALPVSGFSARYSHSAVVVNAAIYLVGGYDHGLNYRSDVWEAREDPQNVEWVHHRFCACCAEARGDADSCSDSDSDSDSGAD